MTIKEIRPYPNSKKGLEVTPELLVLVLKEIMDRMTGVKKGGPFNEPLDQIILNQKTVIDLGKEFKRTKNWLKESHEKTF